WLWRFEFYCGGLRPPIIPPKSIFVYPEGSSKVEAGGAPSLTLVNSMLVPSAVSVLIGKKSFWSIHAVLTLPFLSVVTHLSHTRPFTVSVPTFLQVVSADLPQGF